MTETNAQVAQRIQEKYDFYTVSLTFTLLALAVQSATLKDSAPKDMLELGGWTLLFLSGICGLSRLRRTPKVFRLHHGSAQTKSDISRFEKARLEGNAVSNHRRRVRTISMNYLPD